jgi:hypothetical protein
MKYYYLTSNQTKIETTKEMFDSQVQYEIEKDAFFENGGHFDNFGMSVFSDFALVHCLQCPVDADAAIVYEDYTV